MPSSGSERMHKVAPTRRARSSIPRSPRPPPPEELGLDVEAPSFVTDAGDDLAALPCQLDAGRAGTGVAHDIRERLLHDPVDDEAGLLVEVGVDSLELEFDRQTALAGEAPDMGPDRRLETCVLKRRGAEATGDAPDPLDRLHERLLHLVHELLPRLGIVGAPKDREPHEEGGQALGRVVVELPRDPGALGLRGPKGPAPELLEPPPLRHVAHGGDHPVTLLGREGAEADLDGELATVSAKCAKLEPGPHGPTTRLFLVSCPDHPMAGPQLPRNDDLDRAPQDLVAAVSEHLQQAIVHCPNGPGPVHDEEPVRDRIE